MENFNNRESNWMNKLDEIVPVVIVIIIIIVVSVLVN